MGHSEVKQELLRQAKKRQISGSEVKILSTDPFFVGSETDYANAQWAAALWDKMMDRRKKPLHLRGFHYWVQSQGIAKPDGVKYAHVDPAKDWGFLLKAAQLARYLGLGEWKGLVDLKHPEPIDYDGYWVGSGLNKTGEVDIQVALDAKLEGLVDEFIGELLREAPSYYNGGYQMYHNEVWCEKNSMGAFINPVCKRYDACYQPLIGQSSVEKVNLAAMRAVRAAGVGKKVRIFYIADFDRYGCLAGSTMVTTNKKETHIRDIKKGDNLVTLVDGKPIITEVIDTEHVWVPAENIILLKIRTSAGCNRGSKEIVRTMITAKNHPIFTYNRGWVNAVDLTGNDVLVDAIPTVHHYKNGRARPSNSVHRRKLMAENPEFLAAMKRHFGRNAAMAYINNSTREERSEKCKKTMANIKLDTVRWEKWKAKGLASHKKLPSKPEIKLIELINEAKLPVEYIGDGRKTGEGKTPFVGGLCADFHVIGEKKLIELSSPGFLKNVVGVDYEDYKRKRSDVYSEHGYKTLFLVDDDKDNIDKLAVFATNGATLVSKSEITTRHLAHLKSLGEVRHVPFTCHLCGRPYATRGSIVSHLYGTHKMSAPDARQAFKSNYNSMDHYELKMYNLACHTTESFVADGVIVHNWGMVSAVARKIEFMMLQQGLVDKDVMVTRLALNEDHIAKFNLPKAPKHGEAVVELDALEAIHPGELGKIIEEALAPYYDSESPKIVDAENRRIRDVVRKELEEKLREPLKNAFKEVDITTLAGNIALENAIDPDFEVPEPGHVIDDSGDRTWMYDSKRSYWSQWEAYKAYKSERIEEEA